MNSNNIARLDEVSRRWSLAGSLESNRLWHNVIYDGAFFMVIGGYANQNATSKIEKCVLEGTVMTCVEQESSVSGYSLPALFLTTDDYDDAC